MAGRGHGVVTRAQLLRVGITTSEIEQRLRTGALLREHRGVYRVGIAHRASRRAISPPFGPVATELCYPGVRPVIYSGS